MLHTFAPKKEKDMKQKFYSFLCLFVVTFSSVAARDYISMNGIESDTIETHRNEMPVVTLDNGIIRVWARDGVHNMRVTIVDDEGNTVYDDTSTSSLHTLSLPTINDNRVYTITLWYDNDLYIGQF